LAVLVAVVVDILEEMQESTEGLVVVQVLVVEGERRVLVETEQMVVFLFQ
jgi:hypothetical protein